MQVGEEWIYRLRDDAPSERVRIVGVQLTKTGSRFEVEFLDGSKAGREENVPATRLRGPWSTVVEYDALMANWARLAASTLTDTEESAVSQVSSLLIPEEVADWLLNPVRRVTEVHDPKAGGDHRGSRCSGRGVCGVVRPRRHADAVPGGHVAGGRVCVPGDADAGVELGAKG